MNEVTIIGAGFAGLYAANLLASEGLRVSLLYKGLGATTLSSGRFCVLDTIAKKGKTTIDEKFDYLRETHPYKVLSGRSVSNFKSILKESHRALRELTGDLFVGEITESKNVIYQSGAILETTLILNTMKGSIVEKKNNKILLVGLENLYEFQPELVKRNLEQNLKRLKIEDIQIETWLIPRNKIKSDNSTVLGEISIDEKKIVREIVKIQRECNCRVLYPPVLEHNHAIEILLETNGEASEIPAEPKFSVGKRIIKALIDKALRNNVKMTHVSDIKVDLKEKKKIIITYSSLKRTEKITANAIILATGNLIGGGIKAERKQKRLILIDTITREKITEIETKLTETHYFDVKTTEILNGGYLINQESKPLNENGEVIHDKLYAAGAIIGGTSLEKEGVGLGLPLISAFKASKEILKNW